MSSTPCENRFRLECSRDINAQQILPTLTNNVPGMVLSRNANTGITDEDVVTSIQQYVRSLQS